MFLLVIAVGLEPLLLEFADASAYSPDLLFLLRLKDFEDFSPLLEPVLLRVPVCLVFFTAVLGDSYPKSSSMLVLRRVKLLFLAGTE